jgi:putative FmdB family regulatory protein
MPVYEYRCTACGRDSEHLQPMGASAPGPCPNCGGRLRKVFGRVAVSFTGWGFRKTDSLLPGDGRKKDFKALRSKAEEISEG